MKSLSRVALALGLMVLIALVIRNDVRSVVGLIGQAGWPLLCLVPLHCIPLGLDVMGWRLLIPKRPGFAPLFVIAAIREAINRLLPVANIGGEVIGAQLLVRSGVGYPAAVSSIIVEMILNILAQTAFLTLGLACLMHATDRFELTGALFLALAGAAAMVLLLLWILRSGVFFRIVHGLGSRLLAGNPRYAGAFRALAGVDAATRELILTPGRLARSVAWQSCGLISGCAETWLALRWLAHPVAVESAVALESLTVAARSLFFIAPAGLGIQEAGLIGFGSMLGLGSDVAIALSLAKRAREVLFGLPALAAWQWRANPETS